MVANGRLQIHIFVSLDLRCRIHAPIKYYNKYIDYFVYFPTLYTVIGN